MDYKHQQMMPETHSGHGQHHHAEHKDEKGYKINSSRGKGNVE